ncbi:hypothetical protein [Azospira sp. I09]|jgi:hypothetical protein|uniref:hypothetical protein n=1 Tax=Azospira sp. I09 TaxID=1765049 RepID=UPI0012607E58|nr:hypothetical protein [Azospira sp. I09]BBN87054.1 hypothetical protein AZSP09_00770 [Azospira sp. I09]
MPNLSAQSAAELLQQLREIDISVPLRTEGRTTEHCERWSICRFLASYAESSLINYPLRLQKRERPDFLLEIPFGSVGIEITEAVPPDFAWADAKREELNYDTLTFIHRFEPGEPRRSKEEIDRIARGATWGDVWAGDAPEREWADAMLHFARRKAEALAKTGFERFPADWLLIYDNWPLPAVDDSKAAAYFMELLCTQPGPLPFDRIFVECKRSIWQFQIPRHAPQPILDLW